MTVVLHPEAHPEESVRPAETSKQNQNRHVPPETARPPALDLAGLTATYRTRAGSSAAVEDVDLAVGVGETVALIGESGSGKSTTARVAAGLAQDGPGGPDGLAVTTSHHRILGRDVSTAGPAAWNRLHRSHVGYVPQDAGEGLNPVRTVGSQLAEAFRLHGGGRRDAVRRTAEALRDVGLDAAVHARRHPHQLSGGQRQRVLIALALIGDPALVVADEPTSALDVTVQKKVLDLLEARVRDSGAALLLITHDLGVAHGRADRVVVLKDGRVVEEGETATVLSSPRHAYTRELVAAVPEARPEARPEAPLRRPDAPAVIRASGLTRVFVPGAAPAVDAVDLTVRSGSTLGIVGESGSGKSTTARILLGLEPFDGGAAEVLGRRLDGRGSRGRKGGDAVALSRRARLIRQDPTGELDPRFTVGRSVAEPLDGFGIGDRAWRRRRVAELLDLVALPRDTVDRRPSELSGGQRQRVALARGLAVDPELLVLDEPVSALDVSVQARILDLLVDLRDELGLTYLFISHDLAVVRSIADEVAVMAAGRVVEYGTTAQVFDDPTDEVTRALLAAAPSIPRKETHHV
ncbi:nickel ABC transporter ATP-binding protein NikE [Corynebacterium sp. AOP12-C2-36]|uniref:nickel ABC transporter ATP-binding protein NikE n=1 Tax=Corynebacterium sp. AOP12-C2-36 TaxID=3457723 RepID=UPI0040337E25